MEKHKIDWLNMPGFKGETWNPIVGCEKVSPACRECYALTMSIRLANIGATSYYKNVVAGKKWNGKTHFVETNIIKPMSWKKPRMIFVCSMSDLFHETVSFDQIDEVVKTIIACPEHIFILLTKRPVRMRDYFLWKYSKDHFFCKTPIDNIWLMTTVENQEMANKRIPILLDIPAAKRGVSIEPMLGPMDLSRWIPKGRWGQHPTKGKFFYPHYFMSKCDNCGWMGSSEYLEGGDAIGDTGDYFDCYCPKCKKIEPDEINNNLSWIICGGESGHNARPMHPDWVRSIRDQCKEANVPFFFKQWGEYQEGNDFTKKNNVTVLKNGKYGSISEKWDFMELHEVKYTTEVWNSLNPTAMRKVGKSKSGNELDNQHHKEFPNFE